MEIKLSPKTQSKKIEFGHEPIIFVDAITINTIDKDWASRFFGSSLSIEITGLDKEGKMLKQYMTPISFAAYIGPYSRFPVLEINNKVYFDSVLKGTCDKYTVEFKLLNSNLQLEETILINYDERNSSPYLANYQKFENLVRSILQANGYKIANKLFTTEDSNDFDFTISKEGKSAFVNIKLYETKMARPEHLKVACENMSAFQNKKGFGLVLIVSSSVSDELKKELRTSYGVNIYDSKSLMSLSNIKGELLFDFQSFLINVLNQEIIDVENTTSKSKKSPSIISPSHTSNPTNKKINKRDFCKELNDIPVGRSSFQQYENKCIEILKHLFESSGDLSLWKEQLTSEDGLHRKDLLCRIEKGPGVYWNDIYSDFHSRYVVFEFKNYTEEITQKEIYTTEKYLFVKALHSVAIIISPKGGSDNAYKAAKGALKEAGKLILLFDNKDMCQMLKLKDSGLDPSLLISQRIDDMLIKMSR